MIAIKVQGLDKMVSKFGKLPTELKFAIRNSIRKSAKVIEGVAKKTVSRGVLKAWDTGFMAGSIRPDYIRALKASVSPHTDYAIYVHEGTRFMRARPFMKVASEKGTPKIQDIFKKAIERALKK